MSPIRLPQIQSMLMMSLLGLTIYFLIPTHVQADTVEDNVSQFIQDMVTKHQFSEEQLKVLIGSAKKKDSILNAFGKPATSKPWSFFKKLYVTDYRETEGVKFWKKKRGNSCESRGKIRDSSRNHYGFDWHRDQLWHLHR